MSDSQKNDTTEKNTDEKKNTDTRRTTAEWVSLGITLLLLASVIGTVIGLWVTSSDDPVRFRITVGEGRIEQGQYYLSFSVVNDSKQTAAQVAVEGRVRVGEGEETTMTMFAYIASQEKTEGVFVFSDVREPTDVKVRVISFQRP